MEGKYTPVYAENETYAWTECLIKLESGNIKPENGQRKRALPLHSNISHWNSPNYYEECSKVQYTCIYIHTYIHIHKYIYIYINRLHIAVATAHKAIKWK